MRREPPLQVEHPVLIEWRLQAWLPQLHKSGTDAQKTGISVSTFSVFTTQAESSKAVNKMQWQTAKQIANMLALQWQIATRGVIADSTRRVVQEKIEL